jgi:DNA-binding SARP family transcriptional activator
VAPDTRGGRGVLRRRVADIVGSALTALLVFAAVPAVLVVVVGDPLSGGLGHDWDHVARVVMSALAIIAWVAWVACCAQLIRAVTHHVRRGHVGLPDGAPLTDRIAARIAVGILAVTTFGVPAMVAGTSSAATVNAVTQTHIAPPLVHLPLSAAPAPTPRTASYVVRPGDSLWTIAVTQLGDGADWTTIAALNLGRTMPDGRRFVDPSLIHSGWDLVLPSIVAAPETAATLGTSAVPSTGSAPVTPTQPAADDTPNAASASTAPTAPSVADPPGTKAASTATPAPPDRVPSSADTGSTIPAGASMTPADPEHHRASSLPELTVLGLGAIGCAALARRSRHRRLLRQFAGSPQPSAPEPSESAVDTDVLLQRFAHLPALSALERANSRLGRELLVKSSDSGDPVVRAICVGHFGVDFWLADAGQAPPGGFELVEGGRAWRLPHHELDDEDEDSPYFPIVLVIGDDVDGTWLLPLRPGTVLPVLGPAAEDLCRAARRVQEAWSWSDLVHLTADPAVAVREAQRRARDEAGSLRAELPVLFFGDPAALPTDALPYVAVITTAPTPASDVSVLVDHQGASIHPLARTVQPHLASTETARLIDELVHLEPAVEIPAYDPADLSDDVLRVRVAEGPLPETVEFGPGPVEVRLLTMTPRLDGLREELPPNRERRAVELVAYLALHRPDAVTGDRLRTRVLGSGDADAAAKTLFNTATAARRAMGEDDEGAPLFPPGTRTGQYRVSAAVTVDVQRAVGLAAIGSATEDPELAMGYLRGALALVDGEPLANALSGYTWWESEGHGGRIAAVLVNAACNLAALAVHTDRYELAQWGLERARLVDPYSESLSRAAMQVAAAAGDADRLRREWRECQRRVDELDPGSAPSPRTERLYGELAQQVLA